MKKYIYIIVVLILIIASFAAYWIHTVYAAHESFDNYYHFRGCVQLLEKTDTYGICKTSSGQTIKIVQYQGRWFLDGDLPGTW
jgi:hypothetical protein